MSNSESPINAPVKEEEQTTFMEALTGINNDKTTSLEGKHYLMAVLQTTIMILMCDRLEALREEMAATHPPMFKKGTPTYDSLRKKADTGTTR